MPPRDLQFDMNGNQHVLRFSNTTWNDGEGALLVGNTVPPGSSTIPALQTVNDPSGPAQTFNVGTYTIHQAHQHFHYDEWGRYELWSKAAYDAWLAAGRPANVQPDHVGEKTTSCVLDEEFVTTKPTTPFPRVYLDDGCDATRGIIKSGLSVGWGDTYDHFRDDQFVPIGTQRLADGEYVLRSVADPDNKVYESPGKADPLREGPEANEGVTRFRISGGQIIDSDRPSGYVTVNEVSPQTSSTNVRVRVLGRDDVSGVSHVRLSNDGATWSPTTVYGGSGSTPMTVNWDLADARYGGTTNRGTRTVYAQFLDNSGKWSATELDTIELTTGTDPGGGTNESAYRRGVLEDGPVGYWRLGETLGTSAVDELGHHNGNYVNGVFLGATSLLESDTINRAARFDGTDDRVQIPGDPELSFGSAFSLEAWITPASLPTAGNFTSIVSKPEAYSLQFNGPQLEFTVIQGGVRKRLKAPVGAVQPGQTYHVMGTYNGQDQKLYLDGIEVGTVSLTGPADAVPYELMIGSWWPGTEVFHGVIDEVAVFGKLLTGLQAKRRYDTGVATVVGIPTPTGLNATAASSTRIDLSWTDNATNETGYVLERSTSSAFTSPTRIDLPANATSYADTTVAGSTTYHYRLQAVNATDSSAFSSAASATTPAPPPVAPAAPTGLAATAPSHTQVDLAWTDNASNETGYVLERSTSSTFTSPTAIQLAANATSYNDSGRSASTQYWYRVRALNGTAQSGWSNTADATTQAPPAPVVPAAPTGLTATAVSHTQIDLAWADNASNETGYVVERAGSSAFATPTVIQLPAGATSYSDTGRSASSRYWYRVRAMNGTTPSAWSNVVNATTQATPPPPAPAAPSGLAATTPSHTQVNLTWADNASNETGFVLERAATNAFTSPTAIDLPANTTSYNDTGRTASTQYWYRVRAMNGATPSAWATAISATTPAAPTTPPPVTYAAAVAADTPISHWRLGEASGTAAADVRGANPGFYRNGTLLGATSLLAADAANRAARFDGVNDFVEIADSASLDFRSAMTLEAWIKPEALPAAGGWASVLSKAESYSLQFNGARLEFTVIQNGARRRLLAPVGAIAVGGTYHVVATYDGAQQRLYINGTQVANRAQTGSATVTTWPLAIAQWSGWGEAFRGTVDDVAVYNKALTAARVTAHHQAGGTVATVRAATARAATARAAARTRHRTKRYKLGPAQRKTYARKGPGKPRTRKLPR